MANPWFRVWSEMVNDPKWRTIARISGQRIGDVIAVFMHMMTTASNATERGRTEGWTDEDVATALDIETHQVTSIREAMQDRVIDGEYLLAWEKRQPLREDGAAERGKAFRERKKVEKERDSTQPNATERNRTQPNAREDKSRRDTEKKESRTTPSPDGDMFTGIPPQLVADFKALRAKKRAPITKTAIDAIKREADKAGLTLEGALTLCCARGWQGFEAAWVQRESVAGHGAGPPSSLGKAGQATAANAQRLLEEVDDAS